MRNKLNFNIQIKQTILKVENNLTCEISNISKLI